MEQCPTCGAAFQGKTPCYRCGTDLQRVIDVERHAEHCCLQSRVALEEGALEEAEFLARQACALHRSAESLMGLAGVALTKRDFPKVLALWREAQGHCGGLRSGGGLGDV